MTNRIILITGNFDTYDTYGNETGNKEFVVSHGIVDETGKYVIIQNIHPKFIDGAYFDEELKEWCIKY